ncbi:MAG: glycine cleavage T C-terminal barrel domain-containing protein [Isosphaeraceae bacterium]
MNANVEAYRAARQGVVSLDRSDRARLELRGPDRAKFLHNLTTNDVKRLPFQQGIEAFVTSPQGKTLGYVTLLADEDCLLIRTDPGGAEHIWPHLKKYGVFDDVALEDLSNRTFEIHVAGPGSEELVGRVTESLPEDGELRHLVGDLAGLAVRMIRESPYGVPGLTLIGAREGAGRIVTAIHSLGVDRGLLELDLATAEALRIEAGTPSFGRDIKPDNLPQEVARDAQAINFVKGCYLGQETVARIDALGHVNRLLRGLIFPRGVAIPPPIGAALEVDGKPAGTVTSSAFSAGRDAPVALAYVRTAHAQAATPLDVVSHERRWAAHVTDLPMAMP